MTSCAAPDIQQPDPGRSETPAQSVSICSRCSFPGRAGSEPSVRLSRFVLCQGTNRARLSPRLSGGAGGENWQLRGLPWRRQKPPERGTGSLCPNPEVIFNSASCPGLDGGANYGGTEGRKEAPLIIPGRWAQVSVKAAERGGVGGDPAPHFNHKGAAERLLPPPWGCAAGKPRPLGSCLVRTVIYLSLKPSSPGGFLGNGAGTRWGRGGARGALRLRSGGGEQLRAALLLPTNSSNAASRSLFWLGLLLASRGAALTRL